MARKGTYLYRRAGSPHWYLRLQYPTRELREAARSLLGEEPPPKIEKSLGTSDRQQAEIIAAPEILKHKRLMLAVQSIMRPGSVRTLDAHDAAFLDHIMTAPFQTKFQIETQRLHEPGTTVRLEDGSLIIATPKDLIYLDAKGQQTKTEPNFNPAKGLGFSAPLRPASQVQQAFTTKVQDVDHDIVETWIARSKPAKTHVNSARAMLALFKRLHPGKTFNSMEREDAELMVKHLQSQGNLSATIKTKIGTLVSAINVEINNKRPRVKFNAFSGVAKKIDDATERLSLSEDDVKTIDARRDLFNDQQWLMWMWCSRTGMRPKEVYLLKEEFVEKMDAHPITGEPSAIRYVSIRKSKNAASTRKIPIPSELLPLLPAGGIRGAMFTEPLDELCRLINVGMQAAGVTSPDPDTGKERKVFYGCRHRVRDRLLQALCPDPISLRIMGHSKGVHDQYGQGQVMWRLQPWIEYLSPYCATRPQIVV